MITNQNFTMYAGDTKKIRVTVRDPEGHIIPVAEGIVRWVLKTTVKGAVTHVQKSSGQGIEFSEDVGKFIVTVYPGETVDLPPGKYYHEAELTDSYGDVSTVMTGTVTLLPSAIQALG